MTESEKPPIGIQRLVSLPLKCRCGEVGSAVWRETPGPDGMETALLALHGRFFERVQKKNYKRMEIACAKCGQAVPASL